MYTDIEVGVKRILFQTLGLIEPGRKIMIRGQKVNKIKKLSYFERRGYRIKCSKNKFKRRVLPKKAGFTTRFHDLCFNLFRFVYSTQQQRLYIIVHYIFKLNYTTVILHLVETRAYACLNTEYRERFH